MKIIQLIFNILFVFLLLFNQSNCQESIILKFELIKENYEYFGYCGIGHNLVFKISNKISDVSIYQNNLNVTKSTILISETLNSIDGYYYYYYQIESSISNQIAPFSIFAHSPDLIQFLISDQSYTCESAPLSLQFQPVYISNPIRIENTFFLKNDNLLKSLENVIVTPTEQNYPFNLIFKKSDKNILEFSLVFNQNYIYKQTASFQCQYSSNSNFVLTITLPINAKQLTSFQTLSTTTTYPLTINYLTKNNWDLTRVVDMAYSNFDSNFFFTSINSTTGLDKNQYYQIMSGNKNAGRILFSFSNYPMKRGSTSTTFSMVSKIYDTPSPIQMFATEAINEILKIDLTVIPLSSFNYLNKVFFKQPFSINYPFEFNFLLNFGDSDYSKPIYPYGISSKNSSSMITFYDFTITMGENIKYSCNLVSDLGYLITSGSTSSSDVKAPVLKEFNLNYLRGGRGYYALLKICVSDDSSGFSFLYYGGNYIGIKDQVSGTTLDACFEKKIKINFDTTCYYQDNAGNRAYCQNNINSNSNYYFNLYPTLLNVPILNNNSLNVTLFEFEQTNSYDLTSQGKLVTLKFNYINSQKDIPIQFYLLDRVYGDKYINFNDFPNNYFWLDKDLGYFKITFYLPAKLCFGSIPYLFIINGKRYENNYFYSIYGDNSIIQIVSNDCNEYPPIINNIKYFGSVQSSQPYYSKSQVGWTLTIESAVNFKYFEFHIVSDLDPLGFKIAYDFVQYNEMVSTKTLDLIFVFDPSISPTQTFKLYNITLIDERDKKSQLLFERDLEYLLTNEVDRYPAPISPLYKNADPSITTFTAISPSFLKESTLPNLDSLTCSSSSFDSGTPGVLNFLFSTSDDTGISQRHVPQLYLDEFLIYSGLDIQRVNCITNIIGFSDGNKKANYSASCQVPYGFGAVNGIAVSLYGVVDTSMNIAGFSASTLKSLSFNPIFYIPVTMTKTPIIESWEPLEDYQTSLTVFGVNFAIDPSNTKVFITYTNDDKQQPLSVTINTLSNVGLVLDIPKSKQSFSIFVQTNNQKSNSVIITYPNSSSSSSESSSSESSSKSSSSKSSSSESESSSSDPIIPTVKCLGSPICGGSSRGKCIEGIGCKCISPFSGIDCSSETIKIPKPTVNETSPNVENEFTPVSSTNNDIKLNTIISIVAIREIDINGNEINKHIFSEWDYKSLSESSYSYNSKISKSNQNVSNIQVVMDWFGEEPGNVTFANQIITINPFSLKYYINIDQYPFDNRFCTLELVMKSTFKSNENDVCSSKQFSLNDETDYISLQIGKYSFEGKFIKRAIIDSKIRVIENKLLDTFDYGQISESSSQNKQFSFIAIQIPYFSNKVEMDPNFGVLVNPNGASSNSNDSICSPKKKLSTSQIAGIIVGGVVFIVVISIFLFIKFSKSSRFLNLKIFFYKSFKKS